MGSRGGERASASGGRGADFPDYEHLVRLWMRTARAELSARESLLIWRAKQAQGRVCLAEGSDILDRGDGVSTILNISRNNFAPGAVDAIRRRVMRFMRFRRAHQPAAEYIAEYDPLCRKAEPQMETGSWRPGAIYIDMAYGQCGPISP